MRKKKTTRGPLGLTDLVFTSRLLIVLAVGLFAMSIAAGALLESGRDVLGAKTAPTVTFDNEGDMFINGKKIFPFGFYHESDYLNRYGTKMTADVKRMGASKFNIVQLAITGPNALDSSYEALKWASENGVYIVASYYKPSLANWMDGMAGLRYSAKYEEYLKETLIAWNTADDFNVPYSAPRQSPTQVKDYSIEVRKLATDRGMKTLTYGSGGGYPWAAGKVPHLFGAYKDSVDILGTQVYPISNNDGSFAGAPLEESIAYYKYSREQAGNKPLWGNHQAFAWQGGRYPNTKETRNMTYGSLIYGVNGIMAYAYHENSGTLPTKVPGVWSEWIRLRKDIDGDFLTAIIDGKRTAVDTNPTQFGKAKVHAGIWEYTNPTSGKKSVYVVVVNTSSKDAIDVSQKIKLPASIAGLTMSPLFPNSGRYGKNMTVSKAGADSYLDGNVAAGQVQVYVFQ